MNGGRPTGGRIGTTAVLAALAVYATAWIYRSSFPVGGVRWFCLLDDAMISMRYARHLAQGLGLSFNPGEAPVEGFTNFLWVLFMAVPHRLGIRPELTSLFVQIAGAACLSGTALAANRLTLRIGGSPAAALGAMVLTGFYGPLDYWTLLGMEVGPLVLLTSWAVVLGLEARDAGRFPKAAYLLLLVATLLRLDAAVLLVATTVVLATLGPHRARHLRWGFGLLLASLAVQTGCRLAYFGDPLPNTYYLKMTGFPAALRVLRGLAVTLRFGAELGASLVLAALVPLVRRGRTRELDEARGLAVLVSAQVAYSIWVGGDAWEHAGGANRFVSVVLPLAFALVAVGISRLAAALARRWAWPAVLVVGTLTAGACLRSNAHSGRASLAQWLLLEEPFEVQGLRRWLRVASALAPALAPDASIAVVWAGAVPYYLERPTVDLLGKCDRRIAHLPMRVRPVPLEIRFHPGHLKWDYAYSIGELAPDVVFSLWHSPREAAPYLARYDRVEVAGERIWLRRDSPRIRRSALPDPPRS